MLVTVRARILFFAFLSLVAVAGLAVMSWVIILKAENTSNSLIRHNLEESWMLIDLQQGHHRLQDLAFKIKAQLLLWDEIETEFDDLESTLNQQWQRVEQTGSLSAWAKETTEEFAAVQALMADMKSGIDEKSYYQVGKVVDFQLFPALEPMLAALSERQQSSRDEVSRGADDLLAFLDNQQVYLMAGSVLFLVVVVLMTMWLRQSVILRLQTIQRELEAMEKHSDLTLTPTLSGRDEVASVVGALERLVRRFEGFIGDVRHAAGGLEMRSGFLDEGAESLQKAADATDRQIRDVTTSMAAISDQASQIEQATEQSAATVNQAVSANSEVRDGLQNSEKGAEHTMDVIGRVATSIHALNNSTGNIEQVIGVIAEIAEQTNLLALNASIEAARAGEHGRGFAVVADEVRTLSRRTSESTNDIRQWVQDLVAGVSDVDNLLAEMRGAGEQNHSNLLALKTHLEQLNGQFDELEQQSGTIRASVTSQRDEIGRVGRRADALTGSAEILTDSVDSTRQISEALRQESVSMRQLIAAFKTRDDKSVA